MRPHIKMVLGFWACGMPSDGTDKWYCGSNPGAAYESWRTRQQRAVAGIGDIPYAMLESPSGRLKQFMIRGDYSPFEAWLVNTAVKNLTRGSSRGLITGNGAKK